MTIVLVFYHLTFPLQKLYADVVNTAGHVFNL